MSGSEDPSALPRDDRHFVIPNVERNLVQVKDPSALPRDDRHFVIPNAERNLVQVKDPSALPRDDKRVVIPNAVRNLLIMNEYFVYILTTQNNKVMYVGVTNNLLRRIYEHKTHQIKGFTQKYNVDKLVYFESCSDIIAAIAREKQIKGWSRDKKNTLVETLNPSWVDLAVNLAC